MADNLRKYTTQEVLNKVFTDSSGNAIGINSSTTKETLNAVFSTSDNSLNVALSGGAISGDVTIDGDLTVNGNGSGNYDEIINGTLDVSISGSLDNQEYTAMRLKYDDSTGAGDGSGVSLDWTWQDDATSETTIGKISTVRDTGDNYGAMKFYTANNGSVLERIRITSAGKLGIGETSPTGYVHISPPSGNVPTMYFEQYTSSTSGTLGEISFGNRAVDGQLATISAINDGANDSAYLAFSTEVTSGALAERMRITSDGKVAIGNTSADGTLHVHTATAGSTTANANADDLVVENSDHGGMTILTPDDKIAYLMFGNASDSARAGLQYYHENVDSDERLLFNVAGGEKMRLTAAGMLKIVQGTGFAASSNTTDNIYLNSLGASAGDGAYGASIGFSRASGGDNKKAAIAVVQTGADADQTGLSFWTSSGTGTSDNASEKLRITSDGKVGIGETAPDKLLTLGQDATDGAQTAYLKILDKDTDTTADTLLEILWSKYHTGTDAADVASIGGGVEQWSGTSSNRNTYMDFRTVTSGSRTEKMRIDSTGDVGIGTSAPNYNSTAKALTVLGGNSEDIGSVEIIGHTDSGSTAVARLYMGNRAGSQDDLVYLETKTGTGASDGVLCFYTSASGTPAEAMRLQSDKAALFSGQIHLGGTNQFRIYSEGSGGSDNQVILAKLNNLTILNQHNGGNISFGSDTSGGTAVTNMILDSDSRISLSNNDSGTSNTIFGKNAGDYNVFVGELAGGS